MSKEELAQIQQCILSNEHGKVWCINNMIDPTDLDSTSSRCPGKANCNVIKFIDACLSDSHMVTVARVIARSRTVACLAIIDIHLGVKAIAALAHALAYNTSLQHMTLSREFTGAFHAMSNLFVDALRLNPYRPADSMWYVGENDDYRDVYPQLLERAQNLGHPTMLMLLVHQQSPPIRAPSRKGAVGFLL